VTEALLLVLKLAVGAVIVVMVLGLILGLIRYSPGLIGR